MSHLRVRPIDKPIVLHSLIFNHRTYSHHSSQEPSFLKLSQSDSQDITPLHQSSLFARMHNTLNNLEAQSIRKISQIRKEIENYDCPESKFRKISPNAQKKQLDSVMCRKLQFPYAEETVEHFNFEMDQNLNYICNGPNQIPSNLATQLIDSMRTVEQKTVDFKQGGESKRSESRWKDAYYSRRENCLNQKKRERKRRTSNSSYKQSINNPVRTYQQILSNYSTSRLLAMQKRGK